MSIARVGTDLDELGTEDTDTISGSHTLGAGSQRVVAMVLGVRTTGVLTTAAPTYGSNPASSSRLFRSGQLGLLIAYWREADLPADGANTASCVLAIDDTSFVRMSMTVVALQGVSQAAPAFYRDGRATTTSLSAATYPRAGQWVLGGYQLQNNPGGPAWANGETEIAIRGTGGVLFVAAEHGPASGAETAFGATFNSTLEGVLGAVRFNPF